MSGTVDIVAPELSSYVGQQRLCLYDINRPSFFFQEAANEKFVSDDGEYFLSMSHSESFIVSP